MLNRLKSGYLAAFFLLAGQHLNAIPLASLATGKASTNIETLGKSPIWHALLHLENGVPQITHPDFLLSSPNFGPQAEIQALLSALEQAPTDTTCRFPARVLWLQQNHVPIPTDPTLCPEIKEFIARAPFDQLGLIFADESVTQPSSILGHSFLYLAGQREGKISEHAISFYTDANTINLPKLLWESMVTGKPGVFALTPYKTEERKYLETEQRNLWHYEIHTTVSDRALIRNHLFELKNTKLKYYFHRYNCATALRNILRLTGEMPNDSRHWVTPKDVIKDLEQARKIGSVRVNLADAWLVTHLLHDLPEATQLELPSLRPIKNGSSQALIALQAYNRWLQHSDRIDQARYQHNSQVLNDSALTSDTRQITVHPALDPRYSAGQTHWRFELQKTQNGPLLLVQFIPVSHHLMQQQHFASAETEMIFLAPSLLINEKQGLTFEKLDIFSMKSLIPWSQWLRPWSTQTQINIGTLTSNRLASKSANASFQLGITFRVQPFDLFFLSGLGTKFQSIDHSDLFLRNDMGLLWRHRDIAKSNLTLSQWSSQSISATRLAFEQSYFIAKDWQLNWRTSTTQQFSATDEEFGLSVTRSF